MVGKRPLERRSKPVRPGLERRPREDEEEEDPPVEEVAPQDADEAEASGPGSETSSESGSDGSGGSEEDGDDGNDSEGTSMSEEVEVMLGLFPMKLVNGFVIFEAADVCAGIRNVRTNWQQKPAGLGLMTARIEEHKIDSACAVLVIQVRNVNSV